ncbi:hypothetical protein ACRAWF_40635 [Streptomyces sp. L7]
MRHWSRRASPTPLCVRPFRCRTGSWHRGARRLFRLLGLFPGAEFTAEAAAALLDTPLPQARRLIGALASAHLIEPATAARYRFHDLLREYAQECALVEEAAPDREAALERLLVW